MLVEGECDPPSSGRIVPETLPEVNAWDRAGGRKSPPYKEFRLEVQALEVGAEGVGQIGARECELDRRLEEAQLLAKVQYLEHVAAEAPGHDDAIATDLRPGNAHHGQHRAAVPLEDVEQLPHARHPRDDDVVAEEDPEGLVADERARAEDGVAEAEWLLLAHVGDGGHLRDGLDLGQLLELAPILQVVLELEGRVEVILDGALVAARDEDDLVEPGGYRLLHHVLDGGLVDEGH